MTLSDARCAQAHEQVTRIAILPEDAWQIEFTTAGCPDVLLRQGKPCQRLQEIRIYDFASSAALHDIGQERTYHR
jgi:hypothetical protein